MKTKLTIVASFMFASLACAGQDSITTLKKNAIYLELFGNGISFSINYERIFFEKNNIHLCARIGYGYLIPLLGGKNLSLVPFEVNMLLGEKKKFFEAGLGFTYNPELYTGYYDDGYNNGAHFEYHKHILFLRLGYRYQGAKGFAFRIAPMLALLYEPDIIEGVGYGDNSQKVSPYLGLSFGQAF